jgi:hypothetical protein
MKRRVTAIYGSLAIVSAAMLAGCHPANPLVGKWQTTQSAFGMSITTTRDFRPDGTETLSMGQSMGAEMTYTVDGSKLSERVTSMTVGGMTKKIDQSQPPANSPQSLKSVNETFTVDGDKLTLNNGLTGQTQIYDRVKS